MGTTLSYLNINFVRNNILATGTCLSDLFIFTFVTSVVDPDPVELSLICLPDPDPYIRITNPDPHQIFIDPQHCL